MANDSLRTTLCVRFRAEAVACGILFTAARKLQVGAAGAAPVAAEAALWRPARPCATPCARLASTPRAALQLPCPPALPRAVLAAAHTWR